MWAARLLARTNAIAEADAATLLCDLDIDSGKGKSGTVPEGRYTYKPEEETRHIRGLVLHKHHEPVEKTGRQRRHEAQEAPRGYRYPKSFRAVE